MARKLTVDRHGHHPGQAGFDPKHIMRYGVSIDPRFWPVILPLIYSNGGQVFDATDKRFVMNQAAAVDAVQAVVDLATKDHVMPTPAQINAAGGSSGGLSLSSGRVAMRIDGNWNIYFEQYPKKTYPLGIGVLPIFKVYRTVTAGAPLVAWAKTAHPKEAVQMIECVHENAAALWRSGIWLPTSTKQLFGSDATWYKAPNYPSNYRTVAIDTLKYAQDTPLIHTAAFGPAWTNLVTPANTMTIEVFAIAGTVLACSMGAYSFARLRWPGRDVVFVILLSVLMLPSFTTLIPNFILWQHLGAVDTLIPLIVPAFFGNSFYIFLLRQFFRGIPRELEDTARVDGAGIVRTFATIILPLSKPALAVVTIFTFIGVWDDYLGPLIYLNSEGNYTLTLGLQFFLNQYGSRWDLLMAASTVVSIPMILAFLLLQRYFIEGVTLTGLKG